MSSSIEDQFKELRSIPSHLLKKYCSVILTLISDFDVSILTYPKKRNRTYDNVGQPLCYLCQFPCEDWNDLKSHLSLHGVGDRSLKCLTCEKIFPNEKTLRLHMDSHANQLFHCEKCDKSFRYESTLISHQRSHSNIDALECALCLEKFSLTSQYRRHMKAHQKKSFQCEICKKYCVSIAGLISHARIHNNLNAYKCEVCPEAFRTFNQYTIHKRKHQTNCSNDWRCHICYRSFVSLEGLRTHELSNLHLKNAADYPKVIRNNKSFRPWEHSKHLSYYPFMPFNGNANSQNSRIEDEHSAEGYHSQLLWKIIQQFWMSYRNE